MKKFAVLPSILLCVLAGCDSPTKSQYRPDPSWASDIPTPQERDLLNAERDEYYARQVAVEQARREAVPGTYWGPDSRSKRETERKRAWTIDATALERGLMTPDEWAEKAMKDYAADALTVETPLRTLSNAREVIKAIDEGRIPHVRMFYGEESK